MPLANCRSCRKLFNRTHKEICPECERKEEEIFQKVKDFLKENRGATMLEVCEATGVEEEVVLRFLRQGRLMEVEGITLTYPCDRCHTPIREGRFCKSCSEDLREGLEKGARELSQVREKSEKSIGYRSDMRR